MRITTGLLILAISMFCVSFAHAQIHKPAGAGDLERVKELIASDPSLVNSKDSFGAPPLHSAAENGRAEVVRWLLSSGAEVDAVDDFKRTPLLSLAAGNGDIETARVLVEAGADVGSGGDPDARDRYGNTPARYLS
ncbi:MAG TPA: ankyrin repeat domain-containing protein [Acidobacteriota bacterium]|nr:ankyrin repeat domain-containing protein [Acidobacteriota bacterium]